MADFYDILNTFETFGGFDIILPFLLIFAIVFAVLQKMQLFGQHSKQTDAIVALVLGMFLVAQRNVVEMLQAFLPRVSMVVIVLLMLLLVLGIFGAGASWSGIPMAIAAIVGVIGIVWAFGASIGGDLPFADTISDQDVATLIVVGIFVLVLWWIVRSGGGTDKNNKSASEILEGIGNAFGQTK